MKCWTDEKMLSDQFMTLIAVNCYIDDIWFMTYDIKESIERFGRILTTINFIWIIPAIIFPVTSQPVIQAIFTVSASKLLRVAKLLTYKKKMNWIKNMKKKKVQ